MSSWGSAWDEPTDAEPLCAGPAGAENRHGLRHGRRPGCGPLWLLGYDVPRRTGQRQSVPILGTIRAGLPMAAEQRVEGWATADVAEPEEHFFLRVTGDSMINAGIRDGDLVLLRRQDTAENGQIVACLVDGEDATLKRFRRQRDMVLLQPENPVYEPKLVPLSDLRPARPASWAWRCAWCGTIKRRDAEC